MRYAAAAAVLFGLAGLGLPTAAAQVPHPGMNFHPHWCAGPYGIAGPTDCYGQPVRGIGPPPFPGGPRSMYDGQNGQNGQQRPPADPYGGRWFRSPRDYWMLPTR